MCFPPIIYGRIVIGSHFSCALCEAGEAALSTGTSTTGVGPLDMMPQSPGFTFHWSGKGRLLWVFPGRQRKWWRASFCRSLQLLWVEEGKQWEVAGMEFDTVVVYGEDEWTANFGVNSALFRECEYSPCGCWGPITSLGGLKLIYSLVLACFFFFSSKISTLTLHFNTSL